MTGDEFDPKALRRVVTAIGADGRSTISEDGPSPTLLGASDPAWLAEAWVTDANPLPLEDDRDLAAAEWSLAPPAGGSALRIYQLPPAGEERSNTGMHATPTLDYVVVISGHVWLVMEDGTETELGPGDCAVQRGTLHDWQNRGTTPCVAAAVLIDAGRTAADGPPEE
jgi:mannose-6-phosphate isomerase-like protein (cupin superfamily)